MTSGHTSSVQVPAEIQAKYPDLVSLILGSESMNDEERQYWVNILPIMTPEQIQNLSTILENERKQLAAIDKKYASEIEQIGQTELVRQTGELRKQRRDDRLSAEEASEKKEEEDASTILNEIQNL